MGLGGDKRSGSCRAARAMAHTQDDDRISSDSVANDVRTDSDELPHAGAAHGTTTMREIDQAVPCPQQRVRQMNGRAWVEVHQVIVSPPDALQRGFGPDDTHGLRGRRRDLLAFDQSRQPFTDALMRDDATGFHIRLGSSISASFGRFIWRHIENRGAFRHPVPF